VNHYTDFSVKVKHFFQLFYISFAYKIRALEENDINDSAYNDHVSGDRINHVSPKGEFC